MEKEFKENYVVLKLKDYDNLLEEIKDLKERINDIRCYDNVIINIRKDMIKNNDFDYSHIVKDDFSILNNVNDKFSNYHYRQLVDEFMEKGFSFNETIKQLDISISEYQDLQGKEDIEDDE